MSKIKTMSDAVKIVIDGYPVGHRFFGNQLHEDVVRIYPPSARQYVDTLLRMARRHRRYAFRVVNQNRSLYERIAFKTINERIKEVAPKEKPKKAVKQLSLFN